MNFGAEFDEEIFEKPEVKNFQLTPVTQGAKICQPEWFLDKNLVHKDCEDNLKCLKFQADYFYYAKKYAEACATYNEYMNLLPKTNITARRECMENLARSYLHQDDLNKALEWALQMHAASISADQKLCSWNLLAIICHGLKKYDEELEALHCCVAMHKNVPEFWLRLAYCYSGLFKIDLPGSIHLSPNVANDASHCCSFKSRTAVTTLNRPSTSSENVQNERPLSNEIKSNNECPSPVSRCKDQNSLIDETVPKCDMCDLGSQMISACLIRSRILLSNSERSSFSQLKNAHINERITECLTHLEVEEQFIEEASKVLRSEIYSNHSHTTKEDSPTEASNSNHSQVEGASLEEKINSLEI